jgi:hypothetical protein
MRAREDMFRDREEKLSKLYAGPQGAAPGAPPSGFEEFESFTGETDPYEPGGDMRISYGFADRTSWSLYGRLRLKAGQTFPKHFSFLSGRWGAKDEHGEHLTPASTSMTTNNMLEPPQMANPKRIVFVFSTVSDTDILEVFRRAWFEFQILQKIYARAPLSRHALIGRKAGVLEPACEHYAWEMKYPHYIPPGMEFDLRLMCSETFNVKAPMELWGFLEGSLDRGVQ